MTKRRFCGGCLAGRRGLGCGPWPLRSTDDTILRKTQSGAP
jgi:hypothetical protein